jgi:hypothetical protein
VRDQIVGADLCASDDEGLDRFAPLRIGHADHGRLGHRRMRAQRLLHFPRIDVLAAGDDHVLLAIGDEDEAMVIEDAKIAGVKPTLAQHAGGRRAVVPVPGHRPRPADDDLADLAFGDVGAVVADDPHLTTEERLAG